MGQGSVRFSVLKGGALRRVIKNKKDPIGLFIFCFFCFFCFYQGFLSGFFIRVFYQGFYQGFLSRVFIKVFYQEIH
jgi:hypothetical protein